MTPSLSAALVDADGANMTRSNDRFEIHSVRAVVNYRFGE